MQFRITGSLARSTKYLLYLSLLLISPALARIFHTDLLRKLGSPTNESLSSKSSSGSVDSHSHRQTSSLALPHQASQLPHHDQYEISGLTAEEKIPILIVEPSFLHAPLQQKIAGAERTVIVPAWLIKKNNGEETVTFLEPGPQTLSLKKMNHFVEQARAHLSTELTKIPPKWLRDKNGVIQIALLESPQPLTASTILASDFAAHFTKIFGPELLIAIPSSNRVYIFSKLASPINSIAPKIRDDYKLSLNPISTELFQLSQQQLRAVGSFD